MKYLSLAAMLLIMGLSWQWLHEINLSDLENHTRLQQKVSDTIQKSLKEKYPGLKEIRFHKLWSEVVYEDEIKVVFSYTAMMENESESESQLSANGEARVQKVSAKKWVLKDVKIDKEQLLFSQETVLTN